MSKLEIADRVRTARELAGLSQGQAANYCATCLKGTRYFKTGNL